MEVGLSETEKKEVITFIRGNRFVYRLLVYPDHTDKNKCSYSNEQVYNAFKNDNAWRVKRDAEGNVEFIDVKAHNLKVKTMLDICTLVTDMKIESARIFVYGGFVRACMEANLRALKATRYMWLACKRKCVPRDIRILICKAVYKPFDDGSWFDKFTDLDLMIEYSPLFRLDEAIFANHVRIVRDSVNIFLEENDSTFRYTPKIISMFDQNSGDRYGTNLNFQRRGHLSSSTGQLYSFQVFFDNKYDSMAPIILDVSTVINEDYVDADVNNLTMVYDNNSSMFHFEQRKSIYNHCRLVTMEEIIAHIENHTFLALSPRRFLFASDLEYEKVMTRLKQRWLRLKCSGWKPIDK